MERNSTAMEGKSESPCPRNARGSIRLNRWWDPLRRLCVYLASHTKADASKLRNRPGPPSPPCGGKETLVKSSLKPQKKSPVVDDCLPTQKHLSDETEMEIHELRAGVENQSASTPVFQRSSNPSCANKCQVLHRVENLPTLEDNGQSTYRFGNEAQLPQYETFKGLATTGERSDGRSSLEEKFQKPHAAEEKTTETDGFVRACTSEQNVPQLKKPPVPSLTIFQTSREDQLNKHHSPTSTVYKRSDKYGRGAPCGERFRTPKVSVFKRSDRHGRASLEEKAHRCQKSASPEGNTKGGTGRVHRASVEVNVDVQKPLSSAFTVFKRLDGHGGANMEGNAHRCRELRSPENSVHEIDRCSPARPENQIALQEKPRALTSTVCKESDKSGPASIEENVNNFKKSYVNVERVDKQIRELATTLGKPCLQKTVPHRGNECTGRNMPQLVKLRAPTAVFSLISNRCGRARLEEQGPEFVKPDPRLNAQRTNIFRQTCTEVKSRQPEDRSQKCCTSNKEQCVYTTKREQCARTTEQDNDASKKLKMLKKRRRLWKRKRNQIVPIFMAPTKPPGNRVDTCASLTATSHNVETLITECMRKRHVNEVARYNRDRTCRNHRVGTATMSAKPVVNSSGEPNINRLEAPKAPNEAKGDKRLLPTGTKFTRRPLHQSSTRKGSDLAVHCLNRIHQLVHAPYPRIVEPGKITKIPLSVTRGTRQLSCRVYRPEDFEEVFAHGEQVQLGKGSFGNVALATMRCTDRPLVAVKSFHGSGVREREIFREVEAMQEAQDHWAFPKLHGVIKNRQALSIALEFIGDSTTLMGQTVQNAIRHKKKMKVKHNWISIANDIARGLNHLHSKGFLHCDLKSNNALLWRDDGVWRAKIIDLGKACRIENARGPKTRLSEAERQENFARFPHLPYEVIVGQGGYTVEGDIYSLGYVVRQISTVCSRTHKMVKLATRCYDVEPSHRPTLPRVIQELTSLCLNRQRWYS